MNKCFKKLTKTVFIVTLIFLWVFSGWLNVGQNLLLFLKIEKILAADTGVKTAGTATNTSWTSGWDTTSLSGNDTNIATYSSLGTAVGTLSSFGLNVPVDAQSIDGIKVEIEARENNVTCDAYLSTYLSWNGGSSYTAAHRTPDGSDELPTAFTLFVEGGTSDIWGRTWSASEFSDANFMVKIEGINEKDGKNVEIDYVWITVYYTPSSANSLPVASSTSIDSGAASVTLTENTTTNVVCTATVTDDDGFADITSVEAKLYRTGVGAGAADDTNNHYTLSGDANCIPSDGSGTTENYSCTFAVQFYAEPTDAGSIHAADDWTCQITPSDSEGAGTANSDTIEMDTTLALNVTATIAYGTLGLGNNSGASPQTAVVTNTGNAIMDPQVSSAADMGCTGAGTIPVANQEYSATTFTYGSGTDLSSTPTTLNLTLPKPTSTTPVTDDSFWGIGIPGTGVGGNCTGSNTFTAIAES